MKKMTNLEKLERIAKALGGRVWQERRVYLDRGFKTKKMEQTCFVYIDDAGEAQVSVFTRCANQPTSWCTSQSEQLADTIRSEIAAITDDDVAAAETKAAQKQTEKEAAHAAAAAEMATAEADQPLPKKGKAIVVCETLAISAKGALKLKFQNGFEGWFRPAAADNIDSAHAAVSHTELRKIGITTCLRAA
jgi:rhodanese-related sulfurtransferase